MATPIVYDSGDSGAPQLTIPTGSQVIATYQQVLNVIKTCLVGTGTAYGSKTAAGWTMAYDSSTSGTNPRMALRQGSGSQFYIRIDAGGLSGALGQPYGTAQLNVVSAGTISIGRRFLRVRGYETMSNVDTGTNLFPTLGQAPESSSVSFYWAWACGANSIASPASSITIPWTIIATDSFFYIRFFSNFGCGATDTSITTYFFGDFITGLSSDPYKCIIYANSDVSTTTATAGTATLPNANTVNATTLAHYHPFNGAGAAATPGTNPGNMLGSYNNLWIARPYIGVGSPVNVGLHSDYYKCSDEFGNGNLDYPEKATGSLFVSKCYIHEPTSGYLVRGTLPGLWIPNHTRPLSDMVTFAGTGAFSGQNLISLRNARYATDLNSYNVIVQLGDWAAGP